MVCHGFDTTSLLLGTTVGPKKYTPASPTDDVFILLLCKFRKRLEIFLLKIL